MGERPQRIAINHDDYHAKHVGRTSDGRQFFLTTPFEPAIGDDRGSEYVALYIFDGEGRLLDAEIDDFGPRESVDRETLLGCHEKRLRELGDVTFDRIEIQPFSIERFGTTFGLIPCEPEDDEDSLSFELLPGNYMAFFAPWDSGIYDT